MRDIPGIVREALGKEVAKGGVRSVSGGDINDAYLVALGTPPFSVPSRQVWKHSEKRMRSECRKRSRQECPGIVHF